MIGDPGSYPNYDHRAPQPEAFPIAPRWPSLTQHGPWGHLELFCKFVSGITWQLPLILQDEERKVGVCLPWSLSLPSALQVILAPHLLPFAPGAHWKLSFQEKLELQEVGRQMLT